MNQDEILRQLIAAIQSVVSVDHEITVDTNILRDLGLDSVAVMDMVMQIETKFDAVIPMNRFAEIETVGDLARIVASSMQAV